MTDFNDLPADPEAIAAASQHLISRFGDDFSVDAETILREPLGPTAQCLSIDDISYIVTPPRDVAARIILAKAHLAVCGTCLQHVSEFRQIAEGCPSLRIEEPALDIAWSMHAPVELTVTNHGYRPLFGIVDPASVQLNGPVAAVGCEVIPIEPSKAIEAARFVFHRFEPVVSKGDPIVDRVEIAGRTFDGLRFATDDFIRVRFV